MTTSATSLLGLALPVTGELSGTWGDTVNNSITSLLDTAVAGTTTLSTDLDVTLTTTTLAANQARQAILLCTGARTAIRTITAPAQSKIYTVINSTTGGYSVKIVGVGPTTGVTILAGESSIIAWNGSDFVKVSNSGGAGVFTSLTDSGLTSGRVTYASTGGLLVDSANLTFNGTTLTANTLNLTNALGVAYGGTGLTSGTSGGVLYYSATGTLASSAALAASALVIGGGAGVAPSTTTTGTGVITAIGNSVNTTNGLVTQTATLAASALLLGGGSGTGISSTSTGTGVVTALGINVGTAGSFVVNGGALGTPSSGTVTNLTGTASININGTVGATTQNTGYFTVMRMYGSSSGYVGFQGAAAAGSTTYTLPSSDGTSGQVLSTNGTGTLSWATSSSGITAGKSIALAMIFGF